jgi:agmatinase
MRTPIVSVGIRSQSYEEHRFIIGVGAKHAWPLHIFYAHEIHKDRDWIKKIISKLGRNIYITFDVDVFDPSCLSATGTPEPGGLYWQQVVDFFKVLSKSKKQIVGMDMVELAPQKGNNASDFLCAKLILKILAFFSAQC